MTTQVDQETQIAMLSLDRAMAAMERLHTKLISAATHQYQGTENDGSAIFTWAPSLLPMYIYDMVIDWDQSQAELAVSRRYPEQLSHFRKATDAVRDLKRLGEQHRLGPWEDYQADAHPESSDPFNRFFAYFNKVARLAPAARA